MVDARGACVGLPGAARATPPNAVGVDGPPTLVVMNRLLYCGRAIVWLIDARAFSESVIPTWKSMLGNQLL